MSVPFPPLPFLSHSSLPFNPNTSSSFWSLILPFEKLHLKLMVVSFDTFCLFCLSFVVVGTRMDTREKEKEREREGLMKSLPMVSSVPIQSSATVRDYHLIFTCSFIDNYRTLPYPSFFSLLAWEECAIWGFPSLVALYYSVHIYTADSNYPSSIPIEKNYSFVDSFRNAKKGFDWESALAFHSGFEGNESEETWLIENCFPL